MQQGSIRQRKKLGPDAIPAEAPTLAMVSSGAEMSKLGLYIFILAEVSTLGRGDQAFILLDPSLDGGCPGRGHGFEHLLRTVPLVSSQQTASSSSSWGGSS